jgi:GNAT superfamily N-acetyltransferase
MSSTGLIERALDVNGANLCLGNEIFEAAGATFVRNRAAPDIYDANHVTCIRVSTTLGVDTLFARVEQEFAGNRHRRFDTDHRTYPALIARLRLEDYERSEGLVMLLEGALIGEAPHHDIRPIETDADWALFEQLKSEDWLEARRKQGRPAQPEVARSMVRVDRGKSPPVRYFMAFVDGVAAGYFNAWEGIDGVGQVEDLFTLPRYRNRGVATALVHHCVGECRAAGADSVIIVADPSDTPKHIYARMGFLPIAVNAHYEKRLQPS